MAEILAFPTPPESPNPSADFKIRTSAGNLESSRRNPFSGEKVGPLTPEELDTIMATRAPWEQDTEVTGNEVTENEDGKVLPLGSRGDLSPVTDSNATDSRVGRKRRVYPTNETDGAWEKRQKESQAKEMGPTLVEQHLQAVAEQREQTKVDDKLLEGYPKGVVEEGVARHGKPALLAILRDERDPPDLSADNNKAVTFRHASTGEAVTPEAAQDKIEAAAIRRIGNKAGQTAENATTKLPFQEELVDTKHGLVYVETGSLGLDSAGMEVGMQLVVDTEGGLRDVRVITSERLPDGDDVSHAVDVINPDDEFPSVRIDGEEVDGADSAVEALFDHVEKELEEIGEETDGAVHGPESSDTTIPNQDTTPDTQELPAVQEDESARETKPTEPESLNGSGQISPNTIAGDSTTENSESGSSKDPEVTNIETIQAGEQLFAAEANDSAFQESVDSKNSRVGQESKKAPTRAELSRHTQGYYRAMQSNPGVKKVVNEFLKEAGVDPNELTAAIKSGEIVADSETINRMQRMFKEYNPNSAIWRENEDAKSMVGSEAKKAKTELRALLGGLTQKPI